MRNSIVRFLLTFSLISILGLTGCEFYKEKNPDNAPLPTARTVSFQMVSQRLFSAKCVQCHSPFTDYNFVRQHVDEIKEHALAKRDMPPGAPLSDHDSKLLEIWIDAKMPLNAGEDPDPIPAPILTPTYTSIRDVVFNARCVTCHGPGTAHDDINIFDQHVLTGPNGWVVAGDPANSDLYEDIIKPARGRMPPMKAGPALTAEQIDTIRTWILNGAKD